MPTTKTLPATLAGLIADGAVNPLADYLQDHPGEIADAIRLLYGQPADWVPEDDRLARTEFVVMANEFEYATLWRENERAAAQHKVAWEADPPGNGFVVGHVLGQPVILNCCWARLNRRLVMFCYHASWITHHDLADGWLQKHCHPRYDQGSTRAMCNAADFTECLWYCLTT